MSDEWPVIVRPTVEQVRAAMASPSGAVLLWPPEEETPSGPFAEVPKQMLRAGPAATSPLLVGL